MKKQRVKIPKEIEYEILYKAAHTCSVCREPRNGVQIHHIDNDPSNNSTDNLILLCNTCHDEAHTKRFLSKNLTPEKLSFFKKEWEYEIRKRASLAMLPNNNIDQAIWTFINHQRIGQIMKAQKVAFDTYLFEMLNSKGIIDKLGIPILKDINKDKKYITIYDYFNWDDSMRLHQMYCEAVDSLILKVNPIEIGAIWTKREIKNMVKPGSFIFSLRGYYFKTGKISNHEEDRFIYSRSKNIEIRMYANTRHMFGSSALFESYSGHRFAAAFLLVKSISTEDDNLILHCTPISLGAGYLQSTYRSPHMLKYGWADPSKFDIFEEIDFED